MRKILLGVILISLLTGLKAQSINGVAVSELKTDYIEIMSRSKFMSKKVTVTVDFGQATKLFGNTNKSMQVKDAQGKAVAFNSAIDALNFFSQNGYRFVAAYAVTQNNQNVYHYLMEKKE